jgi:hypothetical protein
MLARADASAMRRPWSPRFQGEPSSRCRISASRPSPAVSRLNSLTPSGRQNDMTSLAALAGPDVDCAAFRVEILCLERVEPAIAAPRLQRGLHERPELGFACVH